MAVADFLSWRLLCSEDKLDSGLTARGESMSMVMELSMIVEVQRAVVSAVVSARCFMTSVRADLRSAGGETDAS